MSNERPIAVVPRAVLALLAIALCLQVSWQARAPRPVAQAEALGSPPPAGTLRAMSLGEPIALAHLATLYVQAFDNQPGISIPYVDLDYRRVIQWLEAVLAIDPAGQYPLMMASQL